MMGYGYDSTHGRSSTYGGTLPAAMNHGIDGLRCTGSETDIDNCNKLGWSVQTCAKPYYIALNCTDPPIVSIGDVNLNYLHHTDITIQCNVVAYPIQTSVTWFMTTGNGVTSRITIDNVKYSGSHVSQPSLTIHYSVTADSGAYICAAENAMGSGQSLLVNVTVTGEKPIFSYIDKELFKDTGDDVTIHCSVSADPPIIDVSWRWISGGRDVDKISVDGVKYTGSSVIYPSLTIHDAGSTDSGIYYCEAINKEGKGLSLPAQLIVSSDCTCNEDSSVDCKMPIIANILLGTTVMLLVGVLLLWRVRVHRNNTKMNRIDTHPPVYSVQEYGHTRRLSSLPIEKGGTRNTVSVGFPSLNDGGKGSPPM